MLRRRGLVSAALAAMTGLIGTGLAGCAAVPRPPEPWEARLRGSTLALLGEVHDNPEHHRRRAAALRRAVEAGWRPALVMEQFDIDRQTDIDRSRRERPGDAKHLIAQAGAPGGWAWNDYEPLVAIALQFDLKLFAANLPRALAARLVREAPQAVFGAQRSRELGLDALPDAAWQAAQEREIDLGHCGALPQRLWAGMARGQFARDAVMAEVLRREGASGAVLLAGNGHVRRDIGVPRWLTEQPNGSVLAVGFLESDGKSAERPPERLPFDAVVFTAAAPRADPCKAFKARPLPQAGVPASTKRAAQTDPTSRSNMAEWR
jgi:uncharacterized iron-regulated protein